MESKDRCIPRSLGFSAHSICVSIPSCLSRFPGNNRIGVPGLQAIKRCDSFALFGDEILDMQWLAERCDLFDRVERHRLSLGPRMTHAKEIPSKPPARSERGHNLLPESGKVCGWAKGQTQAGPDEI